MADALVSVDGDAPVDGPAPTTSGPPTDTASLGTAPAAAVSRTRLVAKADPLATYIERLWKTEVWNGFLGFMCALAGGVAFILALVYSREQLMPENLVLKGTDASLLQTLLLVKGASAVAAILLAVAFAKYCFQLMRVCGAEVIKHTQRKHALWIGQIYLSIVEPEDATWEGFSQTLAEFSKPPFILLDKVSPQDFDPYIRDIVQSAFARGGKG